MDDFTVSSLHESKNEWASRLVTILTPVMNEGLKSIFDEAVKLCRENNEMDKYLMTFQNFISRIPKWNANIIDVEKNRIIERSACTYLEDLVTCVHIIQLKLLSAIRVGQKQKKIDINIPKLDDFIHKIYINIARKLYKNVYLFEINIPPLQMQKNYRELEVIIQECILNTVRESIPVEAILKAYMDETVEDVVVEEIKEQVIEPPAPDPAMQPHHQPVANVMATEPVQSTAYSHVITEQILPDLSANSSTSTGVSFNNTDFTRDFNNNEGSVDAPKDVERLEEISNMRYAQRKLESEDDDDNDSNVRLNISDQHVTLENMDIHVINPPDVNLIPDLLLDDIEILT